MPLAPRQREIEREIDELNRGVLVGAVVVVLFAAGLGASVAGRVSDPVARLTRATRQIAAGRLDVRLVADTADELGRLVDDFNTMAETLVAQRAELARTQPAQGVGRDGAAGRARDQEPADADSAGGRAPAARARGSAAGRSARSSISACRTILGQVKLLRQIASEFANFAGEPTPRFEARGRRADWSRPSCRSVPVGPSPDASRSIVDAPRGLPAIRVDRTLLARALTNLVENALQAMPGGGRLLITARRRGRRRSR